MFNIGLIELLIIFFFLIIFVKPEEIPMISKKIGLFYRKVSRYFYNFKFELSKIESDLEKTKKRKKKVVKKTSLSEKKI